MRKNPRNPLPRHTSAYCSIQKNKMVTQSHFQLLYLDLNSEQYIKKSHASNILFLTHFLLFGAFHMSFTEKLGHPITEHMLDSV